MSSTQTLKPSVDEIVARLRDGNLRYRSTPPDAEPVATTEPIHRRHPLVAVVCCSDCHVAPERMFGVDASELLVLPTPGGRVSLSEAAACRCAHRFHGVACAVVLGHTGCPTMEAVRRYGIEGGLLTRLVASELADAPDATTTDELEVCMIRRMAKRLRGLLDERGDLVVLPALFNATTRGVDFLEPN